MLNMQLRGQRESGLYIYNAHVRKMEGVAHLWVCFLFIVCMVLIIVLSCIMYSHWAHFSGCLNLFSIYLWSGLPLLPFLHLSGRCCFAFQSSIVFRELSNNQVTTEGGLCLHSVKQSNQWSRETGTSSAWECGEAFRLVVPYDKSKRGYSPSPLDPLELAKVALVIIAEYFSARVLLAV